MRLGIYRIRGSTVVGWVGKTIVRSLGLAGPGPGSKGSLDKGREKDPIPGGYGRARGFPGSRHRRTVTDPLRALEAGDFRRGLRVGEERSVDGLGRARDRVPLQSGPRVKVVREGLTCGRVCWGGGR